jgi:hypothetical protein
MEPLGKILALSDGFEKTARLAAWVQSLFEPGQEPVLVGGAAVELLTRGAYTTGNLDNARLQERCEAHQAGKALAALRAFVRQLEGKMPSPREIEDWAQGPP